MSYELNQAYKESRRTISASTQELQEYLIKFSDNQKAYDETYNCTRVINY